MTSTIDSCNLLGPVQLDRDIKEMSENVYLDSVIHM